MINVYNISTTINSWVILVFKFQLLIVETDKVGLINTFLGQKALKRFVLI